MRRLISTYETGQQDSWTLHKDPWDGLSALWDRSAGSAGRFLKIYETDYQHLWDRSAGFVKRIVRSYETVYQHLWDRSAGYVKRFVRIYKKAYQHVWDRSCEMAYQDQCNCSTRSMKGFVNMNERTVSLEPAHNKTYKETCATSEDSD